jgi:non-ribosomal peptide synthetase component F
VSAAHPGAIVRAPIGDELLAALRQTATRERVTPFILALTMFAICVSRWDVQNELVVASTATNRHQTGSEEIVGWFPNFFLIRVALASSSDFRALLRSVRESMLLAYAHQDLSFHEVALALDGRHDPLDSPWLRLHFAYHHGTVAAPEPVVPGLAMRMLDVPTPFSLRRDIAFRIEEHGASAEVGVAYAADLFSPATIAAVLGSFLALAARVAHTADLSTISVNRNSDEALPESPRSGAAARGPATLPA